MARRKCTITYKKADEVIADTVWIQNLEDDNIQNNVALLRLQRDEDGTYSQAVNQDGVSQYKASLPIQGGAYAYISVDTMKALLALGAVKELDDGKWVQLILDPIQPSLRTFSKGTTVTTL